MDEHRPKSRIGRILAWAIAFWVPTCLGGLVVATGCVLLNVDRTTTITAGVAAGVILGLVALSIPSIRHWFMRNGNSFPMDWQ